MATKSTATAEKTTRSEETTDSPLLDTLGTAVKKMLARGKERGFVTYDELNTALPSEQVSSEQIEDTMTQLSEMGIDVVENEEGEEAAKEAPAEETEEKARGNVNESDLGRTDDPVRMYLREMGTVDLLSREGEIAIAKRIEAGRKMMIGGICENPLTIRAIVEWHDALLDEKMSLRDIIDLDATHGGGPGQPNRNGEANANANGENAEGSETTDEKTTEEASKDEKPANDDDEKPDAEKTDDEKADEEDADHGRVLRRVYAGDRGGVDPVSWNRHQRVLLQRRHYRGHDRVRRCDAGDRRLVESVLAWADGDRVRDGLLHGAQLRAHVPGQIARPGQVRSRARSAVDDVAAAGGTGIFGVVLGAADVSRAG